jgi:hypothetical protein
VTFHPNIYFKRACLQKAALLAGLLFVALFLFLVSCDGQRKKIVDKNGHEWPECVPPSQEKKEGIFGTAININGTPYKCTEDGYLVVDQEGVKAERKRAGEKQDLLHALVSRKLSREELNGLECHANIYPNTPYFACVKYAELYDMLVRQWEIRNGRTLPFKVTLSRALGEYNVCPQEYENRAAVEDLIRVLQNNP